MREFYCVYTGRMLPKNKLNREHVIPKSLGGRGTATILVSRKANSRFGSTIDGRLSRDFDIQFARMRTGTRGQNGKVPSVKLDGAIAVQQGTFDGEAPRYKLIHEQGKTVRVQNLRTRAILPEDTIQKVAFAIPDVNIEHIARFKFLLKALLGVGSQYFIPQLTELFDATHVRRLLFSDIEITEGVGKDGISYTNQYLARDDERERNRVQGIFKAMRRLDYTTAMIRQNEAEQLEWSICVLGTLIGSIRIPTSNSLFFGSGQHKPILLVFRKGHVNVEEVFLDRN